MRAAAAGFLKPGMAALDSFLPAMCPACGSTVNGAELFDLCEACSALVIGCGVDVCARCGSPAEESCICADSGPGGFDAARSAFVWAGPIRGLVLSLKYSRRWELARPMGTVMAATWRQSGLPVPDVVTCVPLGWRRYLSRGYNQAGLLAAGFARAIAAPASVNVLTRGGSFASTRGASRATRIEQVSGAFGIGRHASVSGMRVVLVDDVLTTGATAGECARVLKSAGAARVDVVTFARAVRGI